MFAGRELELQFRMSRPLADFMATLHKNGVDEKRLSKFVQQNVADDIVSFYITFPEEGKTNGDIFFGLASNRTETNKIPTFVLLVSHSPT